MKKWLQNLSSAVIASLLAVTLSGKAFASEPGEQASSLSDSPPQIIDSASQAESPVEQNVSLPAATAQTETLTASEISAGVQSAPEAPAAADPTEGTPPAQANTAAMASDTPTAAEIPAGEAAPAAPSAEALTEESGEILAVPVASEVTVDDQPVQRQPAADNAALDVVLQSAAESGTLKAASPAVEMPAAPKMLTTPLGAVNLSSEPADTLTLEENNEEQSAGLDEEKIDTLMLRSAAAKSTELQPGENGNYILVNNQSGGNITADCDIVVLAAGVNHIGTISIPEDGKVTIAGTGILLVDELNGDPQLLTLTDVYEKGSVALFVKDSDGNYVLRNGKDVPGILDEDYLIDNVTLVMPNQTSLLLCGTGAEPIMDGKGTITDVNYYHGTDHDYDEHYVHYENIVEHVGKLTIAEQAALIVQQGASVVLENLKSLSYTDYVPVIKYPEIIVTDGGELTVNGGVNGGGSVTIDGENSVLSGSGSLSASLIAMDATALNNTNVSLSNAELHIRNTEAIQNLKITDCTLIPERIVSTGADGGAFVEESQKHLNINGLETAGDCSVVLPAGSDLVLSKVNGTLTLKTIYEAKYQVYSDPVLSDDNVVISISGNVDGSGTVRFETGYFALEPGMRLNNVEAQLDGGYHVYDYAGDLSTSMFPLLCVDPADLTGADNNGGVVPISVAMYSFDEETKIVTLEEQHSSSAEEQEYPALIVLPNDGGETAMTVAQMVNYLQGYIDKAEKYGANGASVEFLHKNSEGRISVSRFDYFVFNCSTLKDSDELIPMGDVCMMRIKVTPPMHMEEPVTAATQTGTSFTGSGILGGYGAGSVSIGQGTTGNSTSGDNNSSNNSGSNNGGDNNSSNGTGGDNNSNNPGNNPNGNTPNTTADPRPAPLAGHADGAPEEPALVWVELVSAVVSETDNPADTDLEDAAEPEAAPATTETTYVLLALEGEKTLRDLGGKAAVSMKYKLPAEYAKKPLYVVFRNRDNSLTAIRATYSEINGRLRFITDRLGEFMVVGFDFDVTDIPEGEDFPDEFYEALAKLPELENLIFSEVSPV